MGEISLELKVNVYHSPNVTLLEQNSIQLDKALIGTNRNKPYLNYPANQLFSNWYADNKIKGISEKDTIYYTDKVKHNGSNYSIFDLDFLLPIQSDEFVILDPNGTIEFNIDIEENNYSVDAFNLKKEYDSWNYYSRYTVNNGLEVNGSEVNLNSPYKDIFVNEYLYLGLTNGTLQALSVPYKPLVDVEVYYFDGTNYIEIPEALSKEFENDSDILSFVVDKWEGLIYLGGKSYNNLYLKKALTDVATEIILYPSKEALALPLSGHITIDSEEIYYHSRNYNRLYCERSAGTSHVVNTEVIKQSPNMLMPGTPIYCKPKIGLYVRAYDPNRSANVINAYEKGMYVASLNKNNLSSLSLSMNSEQILGYNKFGYLEIGNGLKQNVLKCIAYDEFDQTLSDQIISFNIDSPGLLSPYSSSINRLTNASGIALTPAYIPYHDNFGENIVDIYHDGADTIIEISKNLNYCLPNELLLYQIVKFDPTVGTKGQKINITAISSTIEFGCSTVIEVKSSLKEIKGILFYDDGGTIYSLSVDKILNNKIYSTEIPTSLFFSDAWLVYEDDELWDSSLLNGTKLLVSYLDEYYRPLRPSSINGNLLIYQNVNLALPDPSDMRNNIGWYFLVSPIEISARATSLNERNETIESNEITIIAKLDVNLFSYNDTVSTGLTTYEFFENTAGLSNGNYLVLNANDSKYSFSMQTLPN